jgi:hypothetical protein
MCNLFCGFTPATRCIRIPLMFLFVLPGCDNAPAADPSRIVSVLGPHGGKAVPLPENRGYAEVVVEPAPGTSAARSRVVLVVYFLGPDGKSPLPSKPTSVTASVFTPMSTEPFAVRLEVQETRAMPVGDLRFVSPPGDFEYDELRGEISISLDGKVITIAFTRL